MSPDLLVADLQPAPLPAAISRIYQSYIYSWNIETLISMEEFYAEVKTYQIYFLLQNVHTLNIPPLAHLGNYLWQNPNGMDQFHFDHRGRDFYAILQAKGVAIYDHILVH